MVFEFKILESLKPGTQAKPKFIKLNYGGLQYHGTRAKPEFIELKYGGLQFILELEPDSCLGRSGTMYVK